MSREPAHLFRVVSMASRSCSSAGPFYTIDPTFLHHPVTQRSFWIVAVAICLLKLLTVFDLFDDRGETADETTADDIHFVSKYLNGSVTYW